MGCKPCLDKWTNVYLSKGFPIKKAKSMGKKLLKRIEKRKEIKSSNPYDYSKPCIPVGECTCILRSEHGFTWCQLLATTCGSDCPPPKPNSHYVTKDCLGQWQCEIYDCVCWCAIISGACYYDCDEGYVWNPATQQCELIAPPTVPRVVSEGLTWTGS